MVVQPIMKNFRPDLALIFDHADNPAEKMQPVLASLLKSAEDLACRTAYVLEGQLSENQLWAQTETILQIQTRDGIDRALDLKGLSLGYIQRVEEQRERLARNWVIENDPESRRAFDQIQK